MRQLIILRGPSGSGKSTLAKHLAGILKCVICEADDFFTSERSYRFDPGMLSKAHELCQLQVEKALFLGEDCIVANTNMALKDIEVYLELADNYNYSTKIIRTPGPWDIDILFKRNVHNVPKDVLARQIARYKAHPDETEMNIFS